jgi:hypothetical protein
MAYGITACLVIASSLGMVLGLPWLRSVNPDIEWVQGKLKIDSMMEKANTRVAQVEQIVANQVQQRKW